MKVVILPEVIDYLEELTFTLFEKGYFSYYEVACKYIDDLFDDILLNLPLKPKKKAPGNFSKFGKDLFFVSYTPNKRTTWYIFFNVKDDRYLIRHISNNHIAGKYFNKFK